jgi:hypothetical protein
MLLVLLLLVAPAIVLMKDFRKKECFHGWLILMLTIHYTCFISVLSTSAGINNLRYRQPVEPLILLMFYSGVFYLGREIVFLIQTFLKKKAEVR